MYAYNQKVVHALADKDWMWASAWRVLGPRFLRQSSSRLFSRIVFQSSPLELSST